MSNVLGSIGKGLTLFFNNVRSVIALMVVTLSFAFLFFVVTKPVPVGNQALVNTAAGLVLAGLGGVVGYYFGSSKNESDRTNALATSSSTTTPTTTRGY